MWSWAHGRYFILMLFQLYAARSVKRIRVNVCTLQSVSLLSIKIMLKQKKKMAWHGWRGHRNDFSEQRNMVNEYNIYYSYYLCDKICVEMHAMHMRIYV